MATRCMERKKFTRELSKYLNWSATTAEGGSRNFLKSFGGALSPMASKPWKTETADYDNEHEHEHELI
mgnify:CR=1 FL=1